jgi:alpha/beta superfamily hydrolase
VTDRTRIPASRDVPASLDAPDADQSDGSTETIVVACPPHPEMGGDRRDARLRALSDALGDRGIHCLRFDYGPWDEGRGEVTDARDALAWARENYVAVGLFGYSFGGAVALSAAATDSESGTPPAALSVLAPAGTLAGDPVVDAVDQLACPLQVVYGDRDDTVDSGPIAERARERGEPVETVPADHFFIGQQDRVVATSADFLAAEVT